MGDRANIQHIFPHDDGAVSLYSHWGGTEAPAVCRRALAAANNDEYGQSRWNDPAYGLRLFLGKLPPAWLSGVSPGKVELDNEHPVLVVDWGKQEVRVEAGPYGNPKTGPLVPGSVHSFAAFVALADDLQWEADEEETR